MSEYALLISPLTKSAYFKEYLDVVEIEMLTCIGIEKIQYQQIGVLDFLIIDINPNLLNRVARLSFVQGIFKKEAEQLTPLEISPDFLLHEDFVFAAKYKGKTNELLTQLLLNVSLAALAECVDSKKEKIKLLDPMCGRATTLLWAMRYGISAKGIEQDKKALEDITRNIKKQCKLLKQKYKFTQGFVGKSNKQDNGKFIDIAYPESSMRIVSGNATQIQSLVREEKFHLIVSDLPYGVQHFTTEKTRNPLAVIEECSSGWVKSLKPGGIMALAFNSKQPKRPDLEEVFVSQGMELLGFSAPHRMSESIVRDIVMFRNPIR